MKFSSSRQIFCASISLLIGTTYLAGQASGLEQKTEIRLADAKAGLYFRLQIPLAAYPNSRDSQLSDLRLRNAKGAYLNYAWDWDGDAQSEKATSLHSQPVPIFPLFSPANTGMAAPEQIEMQLERSADGSLRAKAHISQNNQYAKSANPTAAWVIDATTFSKPSTKASQLLQLRFEIPTSYEGIAVFRLEASDDLQQWRQIDARAQLIQLRHQGEQIQQLAVDLWQITARYLRITWQNASTAPAISAVNIDAQDQENVPTQLLWSEPILATHCEAKFCEYAVPKNTPVDSVRINLQETNTLAKTQLIGQLPVTPDEHRQHRHSRNPLYVLHHQKRQSQAAQMPHTQEVFLGESIAYRLQHGDTQLQTKDIALNGIPYSRLKLQVADGIANFGTPPPTISIGTISRSLLFLARGDAPYYLELGGNTKENSAMVLSALIPDATLAASAIGSAEVVFAAPSVQVSPKTELSKHNAENGINKKVWLWLALGVALLLLSVMVWSLLRNMDKEAGTEK